MISHLMADEAHERYAGKRVRVVWNPQIKAWYVYNFTNDFPLFSTFRLELHTVGVYGELSPKYAPNGSPSFVGTIVSYEIVQKGKNHEVKSHPYAPSKLFFEEGEAVHEFIHSRRILLDGGKMFATFGNTKNVT